MYYVNETFFDGQEETLTSLYIYNNKLGNDGFPYSILPNLHFLSFLDLTENDISSLPVLPPNNITILHYEENLIQTLDEGTFANCKALEELFLSFNVIRSIAPGKSIERDIVR